MASEHMLTNPLEFSVVATSLILVWKLLDVAKQLFLSNKVPVANQNLACQQDPLHFQRIKEIHKYTEDTQTDIAAGKFSCQWKDREEVRDYIEASRNSTKALEEVSSELKLLTQELVKTRNGST